MAHIIEARDTPGTQNMKRITLPLAPPLEKRRLQIYVVLLLLDAAAVPGGFCVASWLYLGDFFDYATTLHGQVILPIYWTIALSLQVYTLPALRRPGFAKTRAIGSLLGAEAVVLFVGFATKSTEQFFARFVAARSAVEHGHPDLGPQSGSPPGPRTVR